MINLVVPGFQDVIPYRAKPVLEVGTARTFFDNPGVQISWIVTSNALPGGQLGIWQDWIGLLTENGKVP